MIHPRLRKILRDVWTSRARALVAILSVALGVASTGMLLGARLIILTNLDLGFRAIHPSSAIILSQPFGPDVLAQARQVPGVSQVEGRFALDVRLYDHGTQWRQLLLQALPDYNQGQLDLVTPQSGAWPPPPNQVLLERESLTYLGRKVGDDLLIEMPSGQRYTLRIAGTSHDLNRFPVIVTGVPLSYVSMATMQRLAKMPAGANMNELHFSITPPIDKQAIEQVATNLRALLERQSAHVEFTQIPPVNQFYLYSAAETMMLLLTVLGFVTLAMGGLLVVNTVSALMIEQTRQIGVMKSIGGRTPQILAMYLAMVLVFGLLAVAIAVPTSIWGASLVVRYVVSVVNFDVTTVQMPAKILWLEVGAGLVVPLLAALLPMVSASRMSIRDAIASESLGAGFGESLIDRLLGRLRMLPRPTLLSLRNAFRRKGRLLLTLATLVLGGAFFIAVLSVRDSLQITTGNEFRYMQYDVEVSFTGNQPLSQLERIASKVPGVTGVESWATANGYRIEAGGWQSGVVSLIAPPVPTRMMTPILQRGRWLQPGDRDVAVLSSNFASSNSDLDLGGDVQLNINGRATTWRIVGIVQTRFFGIGTESGPAIYVSRDALDNVTGGIGQANTLRVATQQADAVFQDDLGSRLQTTFAQAGYPVGFVQTIASVHTSRDGPNAIIINFLISMAVLLALVGGLGLAGTMSINVLERIRELGVMRAIGATQGSIFQIVLAEGIVIAFIGWLLGSVLSVPVSYWLSSIISEELLDQPATFAYAFSGVWLWLAIVMGLAVVATFTPAWRATRIPVRAALAYE